MLSFTIALSLLSRSTRAACKAYTPSRSVLTQTLPTSPNMRSRILPTTGQLQDAVAIELAVVRMPQRAVGCAPAAGDGQRGRRCIHRDQYAGVELIQAVFGTHMDAPVRLHAQLLRHDATAVSSREVAGAFRSRPEQTQPR